MKCDFSPLLRRIRKKAVNTLSPGQSGWDTLKDVLKDAARILKDASDPFPPLKAAMISLVAVIDMVERVEGAQKDFLEIAGRTKKILEICRRYENKAVSSTVRSRLESFAEVITLIQNEVEAKTRRKLTARTIQSSGDVERVIRAFRLLATLIEDFKLESIIDISVNTEETLHRVRTMEHSRELERLRYVASASLDAQQRSGCMEGTRIGVLSELFSWSLDADAPRVFWLNGMAGTGKSAITRSFCHFLRRNDLLGGTFFCSREGSADRGDVARILPTLAWSFARRDGDYKSALLDTLDKNPDISDMPVDLQLKCLFKQLLSSISRNLQKNKRPFVLVVDALDECRDSKSMETLLTELLCASSQMRIKFFLSSRPETHVRNQFESSNPNHHRSLLLHDIEQDIVEADIRLYLMNRLKEIQPRNDPKWPNPKDVDTVTRLAGKLFIYAFTAYEYVRIDPVNRLQRLTGYVVKAGQPLTKHLDDMYSLILAEALSPTKWEPDEIQLMKRILAAIIASREGLSVNAMGTLLGISPERIRWALDPLHAVIYVPPTDDRGYVRTFHVSFGDYLTTPTRAANEVFVDLPVAHQDLASACLNVMRSDALCFNVSNSSSSYLPSSKQRFSVPPEVQYVCLHWSHHLSSAKDNSTLLNFIRDVFVEKFLYWLEVLSAAGRIDVAVGTILRALALVNATENTTPELYSFLADAIDFVISSRHPISRSVPHIYLSALPAVDPSSQLAKRFWPRFRKTPRIQTVGVQRQYPTVRYLSSHREGAGVSIETLPDGTRVVSGLYDDTNHIWSSKSGDSVVQLLKGHTGRVKCAAFSPDGTRIATSSDDYTIRIWEASTGEMLATLRGHKRNVSSVVFTADGKRLVSGSWDDTIRVWDISLGETVLGPLEGHDGAINSVSLSPDGKYIISSSDDHTVRLWDSVTGALVAQLEGHARTVNSAVFSSDGTRIVTGSRDDTVRVWDVTTREVVLGPLTGHNGAINSVVFSLDGSLVASGSDDYTIRIWNAKTGALMSSLSGHTKPVSSVSFSPDGSLLASGSWDGTVRVWDVKSSKLFMEPLNRHDGRVNSVAFSSDGKRIVSGSDDRTILLWDVKDRSDGIISNKNQVDEHVAGSWSGVIRIKSAKEVTVVQPLEGHTSEINCVEFSPNGQRIVSSSDDQTIRVWDTKTAKAALPPMHLHTRPIGGAVFSPDGKLIASGSWDDTVRLWDADTGQPMIDALRGHGGRINAVAFSPDSGTIISASDDRTIRLWDITSRDSAQAQASMRVFKGHKRTVSSAVFSLDGARIISGSWDDTVRVQDAKTGDLLLGPFRGHNGAINSVVVSPDGKRVISASDDGTLGVWDISSSDKREMLWTLKGHKGGVSTVALSPDASRIASGSSDNLVALWDNSEDSVMYPLSGHIASITSVAFSPAGNQIVSGSWDGTVRIWDATKTSHSITAVAFSPFSEHSLQLSEQQIANLQQSIVPTTGHPARRIIDARDLFTFKEGWVMGPHDELIVWIPPEYRAGLWWPRNSQVIGRCRVYLDLNQFVHGTDWTKCYTSV